MILLVMAKPTAANSPLKKAILPNVEVDAFFNFKAGLLSMAIFIAQQAC